MTASRSRSSGSLRVERDEIVARAQARADAEARAAIISARAALLHTPEYIRSGDASGKALLVPARAVATGMLAQLEAAYTRANPDKEPI